MRATTLGHRAPLSITAHVSLLSLLSLAAPPATAQTAAGASLSRPTRIAPRRETLRGQCMTDHTTRLFAEARG